MFGLLGFNASATARFSNVLGPYIATLDFCDTYCDNDGSDSLKYLYERNCV